MEKPDGYAAPVKENWAWWLNKGLYGLVQAGRTWNAELDTHVEGLGYTANPAVYIKSSCDQADVAAGGFGFTIPSVLALGRSSMLWQSVWMRSTALLDEVRLGHVDRTRSHC